jgi:lipid A 3-O-deacylase
VRRRITLFKLGAFACCVIGVGGGEARALGLAPTGVFVQAGVGDQSTDAYLAGLTWTLPWRYNFGFGSFGAYFGAAIGRWHTNGPKESTAWPTQISATPTLRFSPRVASNWFAEIGVGANDIVPLFKSGHKRFSTEFNFGDHVGIGREFGPMEVSLRVEHFSNAGISHPNPGENFVQLRYAYHF